MNKKTILLHLPILAFALAASAQTDNPMAAGGNEAKGYAMAPETTLAVVTAAVAMGISERLGGDPALTAVLVILTGILGAVIVTPLMIALRITDKRAQGFAAGLASHGIGTARAFTVDPVAGVFAGVAMGLNAVATPIMVPLILPWLIR